MNGYITTNADIEINYAWRQIYASSLSDWRLVDRVQAEAVAVPLRGEGVEFPEGLERSYILVEPA
ncbi:hypothetical protein ACFL4K_01005 [Candidatus Neomarinimicrobiota bacterium]